MGEEVEEEGEGEDVPSIFVINDEAGLKIKLRVYGSLIRNLITCKSCIISVYYRGNSANFQFCCGCGYFACVSLLLLRARPSLNMMMNHTGGGGSCDLSMDGMSDMDGGSMMGGMGKVIIVTKFSLFYTLYL